MYAVEDRHHPVPPPLSMDRISAPSAHYPTGPTPLQPADHLAPVQNYGDGRRWSLQVVQQPIRARMCGFGDKVGDFSAIFSCSPLTNPRIGDRLLPRHAFASSCGMSTPIKKSISSMSNDWHRKSWLTILSSEIDTSFYVLTVDLWNADGTNEVNLVKHSATSPSISTAMSSSYPPPPQSMSPTYPGYGQNQYPVPYPQMNNNYYGGQQVAYQNQYGQSMAYPQYYAGGQMPPAMSPATQTVSGGPGGMFTRNLIGSLSASAFRLTDPDNKIGVWFILQDLSVRTEGTFR